MPFVKIDLFEGRTEEQKIELAREVTEVVSRVAKAPKEAIHVFINDMPEPSAHRMQTPFLPCALASRRHFSSSSLE